MPAHSVGISKVINRFSEQYLLHEETVPDYRVLGTTAPHEATHGRKIASHSMGSVVSKMMHDRGQKPRGIKLGGNTTPVPLGV